MLHHFCAARRSDAIVGSELGFDWFWVLEFVQGFADAVRHGHVHMAFRAVPLQVQGAVVGAVPIGQNFVAFLQGVDEMLGMLSVGVLDTEIIDAQGKCSRHGLVLPDAW